MEIYWLEQVAGDVPASDDWLSSSEQQVLASLRIPKRRSDWRLGRWTAKQAVAVRLQLPFGQQDLTAIEIQPDVSGAPEVVFLGRPAEISISLSHSDGTSACAIAEEGVAAGCDLEAIETRSEAFLSDYFTADEQRTIANLPLQLRELFTTLIWSAKESALKALRTGLRLDTRAVSVHWDDAPASAVSGPSSPWSRLCVRYQQLVFEGWWRHDGHFVRTVVSVPHSGPPVLLSPGLDLAAAPSGVRA